MTPDTERGYYERVHAAFRRQGLLAERSDKLGQLARDVAFGPEPFDSPENRGRLLWIARELWEDPYLHVRYIAGFWAAWRPRLPPKGSWHVRADHELEVLVRLIEARP